VAHNMMGFRSLAERDQHIKDMILSLLNTSEVETLPDRRRWEKATRLFNGEQDWGPDREENPWMSRVFLHEFSVIVREAASAAVEIVLQNPDFFNVRVGDQDKEFARIMEKIILYVLNKAGFYKKFYQFCLAGGLGGIGEFKFTVQECLEYIPEAILEKISKIESDQKKKLAGKIENLNPEPIPEGVDEFSAAIEEALDVITGDVGFRRDVQPKKKLVIRPMLDVINLQNFFWHPDAEEISESLFLADRSFTTFAEIDPLFKAHAFDTGSGGANRKALIKSMKGGRADFGTFSSTISGTREGQKWIQRQQFTDQNAYLNEVELVDFWGPLLSKDGELLKENCHFVLANREVVLRAEFNKFFHQQKPYLIAPFSRQPFKAVGAGVADNAIVQQEFINDLASLFIDMLKLSIYNPRTVNSAIIEDETQLQNGVKPGMNIEVTGDPTKVFGEIPTNVESASPLFQMLETLRLSGQKGSTVNTQSANPSSRARISATEVGANQARQNRSEATLAQDLDHNLLEPLLNMAKSLALQYSFEDQALEEMRVEGILTPEEMTLIKNIPRVERVIEASRHYRVEIRGFRSVLERTEHVQRALEFLAVVRQSPEVLASVDIKYLLTGVADDLNLDVNRLFFQNSPFDIAREENAMMLEDRFVEVLPDDAHAQHLQVHYTIQSLNEKSIAHIHGHWQIMLQSGQFPPEPPPEIQDVLQWQAIASQQPPTPTGGNQDDQSAGAAGPGGTVQ